MSRTEGKQVIHHNSIGVFATGVLLLAALAPATHAATLAVEFSGGSRFPQGNGISVSAGWSFTPTQNILVTALDVFDPAGTGNVRLYDSSGTLASATLTTSDSTEGSPTAFYTQSITPVLLTASQTYFIAEDFLSGTTVHNSNVTGFSVASGLTYHGQVIGVGLGTNPLTDLEGGTHNPGDFGPNFDFTPATSVPEPTSLLLSLIGLAGLPFIRRAVR